MRNPVARIAIVLSALLCARSVSAQGWEAGARAGISHGALTGRGEFNWSPAVPTASAFLKRRLASRLSIQPELALVRRVGISTVTGSSLKLTADFIELPLMLHLRLASAAGMEPYVSLGPSFAVRARCSLKFVGGGLNTSDDCNSALGARPNPLDAGFGAGAGLNWTVGAIALDVEWRMTNGFRTDAVPIDVRNSRSVGWSVLAGVSRSLRPHRPGRRAAIRGSMNDAQIATMMLTLSNTDISYTRLVSVRAEHAEVRRFAKEMIEEHGSINRQVHQLLTKLDLAPENILASLRLRDKSLVNRDAMRDFSGFAFDTAYIQNEIRVHRSFVSTLDELLIPLARSPDLRRLLASIRKVEVVHLARAERARSNLTVWK